MPVDRFRMLSLLWLWPPPRAMRCQPIQSSPGNRPWPPACRRCRESPVLTPAEALKTFYMPPGYHLELVASEPLVQDPIVMDWDAEGRLWVVEMPGFVRDLTAPEPNLDPIGRVVVARGHEQRRHDGQAHGVCRRADAGAGGQGARPRRAGRRAAERLADARHQRRPEDGHEGDGHRPVRAARRHASSRTRTASTGGSTTGCTRPTATCTCG